MKFFEVMDSEQSVCNNTLTYRNTIEIEGVSQDADLSNAKTILDAVTLQVVYAEADHAFRYSRELRNSLLIYGQPSLDEQRERFTATRENDIVIVSVRISMDAKED
jgi:hypothetical protein